VELNGEDQSKYQKLASDFADPTLNSIIKSSVYQNVPDSMKRIMLEKAMQRARKIATNMMFMEKRTDPEFMNEYMKIKLSKKGLEEE
jgi:hypothetical protein